MLTVHSDISLCIRMYVCMIHGMRGYSANMCVRVVCTSVSTAIVVCYCRKPLSYKLKNRWAVRLIWCNAFLDSIRSTFIKLDLYGHLKTQKAKQQLDIDTDVQTLQPMEFAGLSTLSPACECVPRDTVPPQSSPVINIDYLEYHIWHTARSLRTLF